MVPCPQRPSSCTRPVSSGAIASTCCCCASSMTSTRSWRQATARMKGLAPFSGSATPAAASSRDIWVERCWPGRACSPAEATVPGKPRSAAAARHRASAAGLRQTLAEHRTSVFIHSPQGSGKTLFKPRVQETFLRCRIVYLHIPRRQDAHLKTSNYCGNRRPALAELPNLAQVFPCQSPESPYPV